MGLPKSESDKGLDNAPFLRVAALHRLSQARAEKPTSLTRRSKPAMTGAASHCGRMIDMLKFTWPYLILAAALVLSGAIGLILSVAP